MALPPDLVERIGTRDKHASEEKKGEHTSLLLPVDAHEDHRFYQVIKRKLTSTLYLI